MNTLHATDSSTLDYYKENAVGYAEGVDVDYLSRKRSHFASLLPGKSILDAGCGTGRDAAAFSELGYSVTAIDACPEMIAATRAKGVTGHVLCLQDVFWGNHFDGIWSCASLLHVPLLEVGHVAKLLAFALKPNGVLWVSVKKGAGEAVAPDGRFFSYFSESDLLTHFENAGLITIDISSVTKPDSSGSQVEWLIYIGRKLAL